MAGRREEDARRRGALGGDGAGPVPRCPCPHHASCHAPCAPL